MKKIIYWLLRYSGIPFLLRECVQRKNVTVLAFHDPSLDTFLKCVRYLTSHYNIIPLSRYIELPRGRKMHPPKSIIITLDDGHKNNYKLLNIIKAYKVPVTIFLCSDITGTNRHFWWTHVNNMDELKKIKRIPEEEKVRLLKDYDYDYMRDYGFNNRQSLSAEEITEMELCGYVDFQSHTMHHVILDMCNNCLAFDEIELSKINLESWLNKRIYALAYPNGIYTDRDISIARNAGYKCGLTMDPGFNNSRTDPYRIKRLGIKDTSDIYEIILRTSGLWGYLKKIKRALLHGEID